MGIDNLIRRESGNILERVESVRSGTIVQNNAHKKRNLIDITTDPDIILRKMEDGWSLYPGKRNYILQAPETVICDLSEIGPNKTDSLVEISTIYRTIKQIGIQNILGSLIHPLYNDLDVVADEKESCDSEIRIAGSDRRVYEIPDIIINSLKGTPEWNHNYHISSQNVEEREIKSFNRPLKDCKTKTRKVFENTKKVYDLLGADGLPEYAVTGPWNSLPECEKYIFVMKSGFKYALGFSEDTEKEESLCLWEYHEGISYDKEIKIGCQDLEGKTVAIIDRSYSGNTLDTLRDDVIKERGLPRVIAVYPKSSVSAEKSDYMIFLDRVVSPSCIEGEDEWALKLFEEISKEGKIYGD